MNETAMSEQGRPFPAGTYRPKLTFYHANARGTGCAVALDLHPAHDDVDGSVMVKMANQVAVGNRNGPNPTFSRFDWQNGICVKLDFNDLCRLLQVFRGECESIDEDHGLLHRSPTGLTRIQLRHVLEPAGYSLELRKTRAGGGEDACSHILFSPAEALGLCEAISGSLHLVAFGLPMVIEHDTSAYAARTKEMRNATAA